MLTQRVPSLRRNFSWTFLGNAAYAASQWLMITVIARLGSPEMVGRFTLGLAVTAPVMLLTNLNLRAVQATDAKRDYRFGDYLALRIAMTTLAYIVIAIAAGFYLAHSVEQAVVILLFGVARIFESMSDVFYGLYLQRERMERLARSLILKGVLSLAALGGIFSLTGSVVWAVAGVAVAWAAVFLFYDVPNGRRITRADALGIRPLWSAKKMVRLAWVALPLGIVMMLLSLNANIPRYFIESYQGPASLGIFAALSYVVIAGTTVVVALGQSASPRLSRHYADGDKEAFVSLLAKAVGVAAVLGIMGVIAVLVAGKEILTVLYGPEYARHVGVFAWLMASAAFGYVASFLGYGMTAARYFKVQAPLFALGASTIAVACWLLVPAYGLLGAALALITGSTLQLCGSLIVIAHALRAMPESPEEAPEEA